MMEQVIELADEIAAVLNRHKGLEAIAALAAIGIVTSRVLAQISDRKREECAHDFAMTLLEIVEKMKGGNDEHIRKH